MNANNPSAEGDEGESGKVIDPQSFVRLNEVRKDLYKGAAVGLAGGSLLGYIGFHISSTVPALRKLHSRNTLTASVMLSGAFGSFLFALMRGQQSVVFIGDVFSINASPRPSPYMAQLRDNERKSLDRPGPGPEPGGTKRD